MRELKVEQIADLAAAITQLQTLAKLGFQRGVKEAYLSISQESSEVRTREQNSLLWPLLKDMSGQAEHFSNKYSSEQWKDILSAGFEGVTQYAPNLDGTGLVAFGARTSKYSKKKMSEFIEFVYATGSERGVEWSEKSEQTMSEVRS